MKELLYSLCMRVGKSIQKNARNAAAATDTGDYTETTLQIAILLLKVLLVAAIILGLVVFVAYFWSWLLILLGVPGAIIGLIMHYAKKAPQEDNGNNVNPVDEGLMRQRGLEMCDLVFGFMLAVIIKVSCNTKLSRPRDECDIQRTTVNRDPFVIKDGVVIYLIECDLESTIDTAEKDTMREAIQRQAVKEINRFPSLISNEAQERAPVEILDIVNLQNHVMIQVVFTSAASIKMIDSSRRARLERQQKQQTYIDADYAE